MTDRRTRKGMIVTGLVIWVLGIAATPVASQWTMPGILLGATMVAFAVFGLLTEPWAASGVASSWQVAVSDAVASAIPREAESPL